MTEHVYFIGNDKEVKIGKSNNLSSRFSAIQTSSPTVLEILTSVRCVSMTAVEKMLHKVFAPIRYKGEWFYRVGDLASLITQLQAIKNPSEFDLGVIMGQLNMQTEQREMIVHQHRLRAMHKALLSMGFDVNSQKFIDEQNRFIDGLVEQHPTVYKRFFTTSVGTLMQTLDAPYQPYPVYEVSIAGVPNESLVDQSRPESAA